MEHLSFPSQKATETDPVAAVQLVDRIWRYVVGFGAILAVIALWLRLTIPESPRFALDVAYDAESAVRDIRKFHNINDPSPLMGMHSRRAFTTISNKMLAFRMF
jgi:hypothetical protein